MSLPYRLALVGASLLSAIALYDAAHHGVTGRSSAFSDEYGWTPLLVAGNVVHGLAYVALVTVLVAARALIDPGHPVARWIRRLLVAVFAVLAAMFLLGLPIVALAGESPAAMAVGGFGGIAFLLMFVLSFALGVALARRPELRVGAVVLLATVPMIGLASALQVVAPTFAHPAYAEVAVAFGVALLGRRPATAPSPAARGIRIGHGRVAAR